MIHVVLVEPEIPPNTGNVARLCAVTRSKLHLVGPLGFEVSDRTLRRAGLDYWKLLDYEVHPSWDAFASGPLEGKRFHLLSTKTTRSIYSTAFQDGDFLIFGKETKGLPAALLEQHRENCATIPMANPEARCLNLSSSAAIVLYEALRQTGAVS